MKSPCFARLQLNPSPDDPLPTSVVRAFIGMVRELHPVVPESLAPEIAEIYVDMRAGHCLLSFEDRPSTQYEKIIASAQQKALEICSIVHVFNNSQGSVSPYRLGEAASDVESRIHAFINE
eukprot:scaffold27523_cov34-Prasinocladus_malaysianus.AAC.2